MDEENERDSVGAYDNMERPNIRPNFAGEALGRSAVDFFRNREESAKNVANNATKNTSKKVGEKATGKAAETALNAATGGVGGTVLKAAEKTGAAQNYYSRRAQANTDSDNDNNGKKRAKGKGILKKAPSIAIIFIFVLAGAGIFVSSSPTLIYKAFSALVKEKTEPGTGYVITDFQVNNAQLGGATGSSEYDVVFNDMGFSDYQIQSFKNAGLDYAETEDGTKALVHNNPDGSKIYYVADAAVTGYVYADEAIGDAGMLVTDSGAETKSEDERLAELATILGAKAEDSVQPFSKIKNNFAAKNEYIAATSSYRGGEGIWYSDSASTTQDVLGINLNTLNNYELSANNAENEAAVIKIIEQKNAANAGSGEVKNLSLKEYSDTAIENSRSAGCGYDSAATLVGSITNSLETYKQMSAGSLFMEAIDKTLAGFGNSAPANAMLNLLYKAKATASETWWNLFGNNVKVNQDNENNLATSAQSNLGETGNPSYDALGDEKAVAETCVYVNSTNSHDNNGFIAKIGNMFTRVTTWIKNGVSSIASFFFGAIRGGAEEVTSVAVEAIEPAVNRFNKMIEKSGYFTGEDDSTLGNVVVNSAKRITNIMSRSVAGTTAGDTAAVTATYRIQQEIIAEKAAYDRTTKSPFDITSEHTFLGSIVYSLIPFATSTTALSLSSTISNFGSVLGSAITSLLPTSSAISETKLALNYGDCIHSNSVGAFAEASCNEEPQTYEKSSMTKVTANIFDEVVNMRKDDGGYIYGISADETESNMYTDYDREEGHVTDDEAYKDGTGRYTSDPDYGNGPLNTAENDLPSFWGTGGKEGDGVPHGCESDWQYSIESYLDENNKPVYYRYYHFDHPSEWKYSRITNFEYDGYKTGFPNLVTQNSTGKEDAKNDEDPGSCMLDLKTDSQKQPIINRNGALGTFLILSGQRTSELGVSDQKNVEFLANTDFIHGRYHPCSLLNDSTSNLFICKSFLNEGGWSSDEDELAKSPEMSRFISGSAYVNYHGDTTLIKKGFETEAIFEDPTRGGARFTEEINKYTAYVSLIEWMEANDLLKKAGDSLAVENYYKDNPLDNSLSGILARYSGQKKETVIAVLNLIDYANFLASYNPTDLYPLTPKTNTTTIYTDPEIIATLEPIIDNHAIIFDELRNRTVTG